MIEREMLDIAVSAVQILILAALAVFIFKIWRISTLLKLTAETFSNNQQTMKDARDLETAPYMIAFFDIPFEENMIYLVLKNTGKSTARDVKIVFKPKVFNSAGEDINELALLKNGIATFHPGNEIRIFIDSTTAFFFEQDDQSLIYDVKITYYGGLKDNLRVTDQLLDLASEKRLIYAAQLNRHNMSNEVEKISRNIERIRKEFSILNDNLAGGIQFRNALTPGSIQTTDDSWQNVVKTKLLEFNHLWSTLYGGNRDKLVQPFLGKIKNRLNHITDQLLVTTSLAPSNIEEEMKNKILDIVARLSDLNSIRINPNDSKSISSFDTNGDKIAEIIKDFVEKIKSN